MAIVSINMELIAEIPLTINDSSRQEGQSYVDLNQLEFHVKVVGDVIAAE